MTENVNNVTTLPKKSFFNKTNAIRVGVAALVVAVAAVAFVKLKADTSEIVDAVAETITS